MPKVRTNDHLNSMSQGKARIQKKSSAIVDLLSKRQTLTCLENLPPNLLTLRAKGLKIRFQTRGIIMQMLLQDGSSQKVHKMT